MKTLRIVIITLISVIAVIFAGFFLVGFFQPKPGGILVNSDPASSIYINGILVGKTPYRGTFKAGEVVLKMVPDVTGTNLLPFETKIRLTPGIETVVRREFGDSEDTSSGDVVSFDKETGKTTSLIVVSTPENAQISLDGVPRGFAPYKNSTISPAEHQISIKSPGFLDRIITVKVVSGFRLTVFAKLAKTEGEDAAISSPTPEAIAKRYVEILQTPTGFLRLRTKPGTGGEEIAELKTGSVYLLLETDLASGWYKIQYSLPEPGLPNGITGWISNQYAKEVSYEASTSGIISR